MAHRPVFPQPASWDGVLGYYRRSSSAVKASNPGAATAKNESTIFCLSSDAR